MSPKSTEHSNDPKVVALQRAFSDHDPYYSGTCVLPDYQRLVYYAQGNTFRRIDFTNAGEEELAALYQACKPAEFGRNGENVLDESYRKAGKMDLSSFSTPFDPRSLGIHDQVFKALLTEYNGTMEMELYKLNVYGPGDFFRAHQDTPRSTEMFGSLVVVLPTKHEGGQLVLRQEDKEWTIDFAEQFAAATEPSVCFISFFSDIEHEVLPVTSGYRVTLTYNLFHNPSHITSALRIPTPAHQELKQALLEVLRDPSKLPNGGYLGFGLVHQYAHPSDTPVTSLMDQLKGADRALANVCDELGLRYRLKLFYRDVVPYFEVHLITDEKLPELTVQELDATIDEVEGVNLFGAAGKVDFAELEEEGYSFLRPFYREPIAEVMEITPMKSSVRVETPFLAYGNETSLEFFYGTACMLIAVESAGARLPLASASA